jgi:hypothetical protein
VSGVAEWFLAMTSRSSPRTVYARSVPRQDEWVMKAKLRLMPGSAHVAE